MYFTSVLWAVEKVCLTFSKFFIFELFAFKTVGFQSSRSFKNKGGEAFHGMRQRPVACYNCGRVVTSSISFVSVQARKLIHFAVPPFPKKSDDFSGALFSASFAVLSEHRSCPGVSPQRRCASSAQASYHSPSRRSHPSRIIDPE